MIYRSAFAALLLASLFSAACKGNPGNPNAPSTNVPFSATDLRVGTGAEATAGRQVTVSYTGWLYDANAAQNKGRQFDSSPGFGFAVGTGRVIPGFDRGVLGMRVGGQRRIVIPPDQGYGSAGSGGVIPPNATLIFEVELLNVQ